MKNPDLRLIAVLAASAVACTPTATMADAATDSATSDMVTSDVATDSDPKDIVANDATTDAEPSDVAPDAQTSADDDLSSAPTVDLTAGVLRSDSVSEGDDQDFVRFEITAETELDIRLAEGHGTAELALIQDLDGDGVLDPGETLDETESVGDAADDVHLTAQPGTYYARVRRVGRGTSNYQLTNTSTSVRRNGRTTPADALDLGALSTEQVHMALANVRDPVDYYRFRVDAASDVTVILDGLAASADADLLLAQDINNDGVVSGDEELMRARAGRAGVSEVLSAQGLPAGTYLLRVDHFLGADTDYTLRLAATPMAAAATPLAPSIAGLSIANPLVRTSGDFTATGTVGPNAPRMFYRVTLGAAGYLALTLSGLTGDADVRVGEDINGNGRLDAARDVNNNTIIEDAEVEIYGWLPETGLAVRRVNVWLPAGTYIVEVFDEFKAEANFTLESVLTPAVAEERPFRFQLNYQGASATFFESVVAPNGMNYRQLVEGAARMLERTVVRSPFAAAPQQVMNVSVLAMDAGVELLGSAGAENNMVAANGYSIPTTCVFTMNTNPAIFPQFRSHPQYFVDTAVHELLHCLGFGFWEMIPDGAGNNYNLIRRRTVAQRGEYLTQIMRGAQPVVTYASLAYGDMLRQFTPVAVPITDDTNSEASDYAHWRIQVFRDEMKVHAGEATGPHTPTSALTVAGLRDLGWEVNYGAAEDYVLPDFRPALTPLHRERSVPSGGR